MNVFDLPLSHRERVPEGRVRVRAKRKFHHSIHGIPGQLFPLRDPEPSALSRGEMGSI